jgi:plasmid stabilization system protein ParE
MNRKSIEYHEGATADVKSAVAWYQKRSPKAAQDFVEELRRAAETICRTPQRWPKGKNDTRRFLLWRFPFSMIYSAGPSKIVVWPVAHSSRRPEYWSERR